MSPPRSPFPWYGFAGLAVVIVSEILMFRGVEPVATFFTPLVWTGYIAVMDGLVFRLRGVSLLRGRRPELAFLIPLSVVLWLVFELYNFSLRNWTYINLPEPAWVRWVGYAWAFATILPGIFETAEWLEATGAFARCRWRPLVITPRVLHRSILIGAVLSFGPLVAPPETAPYLFGTVWVGYAFLLDPFNYFAGRPSLFRDLAAGRLERFACLFIGGLICGVLWEFWNYWAQAKWVYTVPIMPHWKLFEMPLLGYLGFPAFAYECFVISTFVRSFVRV